MSHKDDLKRLKSEIESFEDKKKNQDKPMTPMGALMNVGIEFVSGVVVGIGLGFLVDWAFSTKPWGLIAFFALGSAAGMLNVYRTLTKK